MNTRLLRLLLCILGLIVLAMFEKGKWQRLHTLCLAGLLLSGLSSLVFITGIFINASLFVTLGALISVAILIGFYKAIRYIVKTKLKGS